MKSILLALALLSLLVFSGCGGGGSSNDSGLTPVRLQTDWYAQPEHGGFYQAKNDGTYAAAGLDVTINQGGPNALIFEKLLTGRTDFAIGRADDVIMRISEGMPLVVVGVMMQHDPQCLMLHGSNPVETFADLDGKRVMATPEANWIRALEAKYEIKLDVIAIDYGMERFLADENFIQQAFITNEPYYIRKNGAEPKVFLLADAGFDPYRVIYTTKAYASANPEAVEAFVAGSTTGWTNYLQSDPSSPTNQELIGLNLKLDAEFVSYSIQTMIERELIAGDPEKGQAIGKLDPARILQTITTLSSLDLLKSPLSVEDVVFQK